MFKLEEERILKNTSPIAISKGEEYYKRNRVKSITFNQQHITFDAVVEGSRNYSVNIGFSSDGSIHNARCTCAAYKGYWGYCKHIVATLLLIRKKDEEGFFNQLKTREIARKIFNFFESKPETVKSPVYLEAMYEYGNSGYFGVKPYSALSLRIGDEKLYIVRDVKKLLECIKNGNSLPFGKKFTYNPQQHIFTPEDHRIVDFLIEFYEMEEIRESLAYGYNRNSVFKGKQVVLAPSALKRFFDIIGDRSFKAEINGMAYEDMHIAEADFPLEFYLTGDEAELVLDVKFDSSLIPLTDEWDYVFLKGVIYKISSKQKGNFKPFYTAIQNQNESSIRFLREDRERFVSEVIPFAEKAGRFEIDEKVQSIISKVDLDAEIYLDRSGDYVTGKVKFIYGDRVINPFAPDERKDVLPAVIILRDVEGERRILDLLGESDFKVRNNEIYLDEDDKVFDFISVIIPRLQQYAHVFYSDSFKSIQVRNTTSFSGRIRLNDNSGMLEFNFNIDGIESGELADIFDSYKEKKKYYRLKDGTFLKIDTPEFDDVYSTLVDQLELGRSELNGEYVELPRMAAMYIDEKIKNSMLRHIERNHAFKEFVQNVWEPEDADYKIPTIISSTLREYQKFGFKWLKTLSHYNLGGILADDMGLGKTLEIISLILSDRDDEGEKPSLIIVPTTLVFNWQAEIEKFAPTLRTVLITGSKDDRQRQMEEISGCDIAITSYPLIRRDIDDYSNYSFRYCILDEAQYIKNYASQNAQSVKMIKAEKKFALTGTPIENALSELWSIFDFILPGYLASYTKFVQKYEKPIVKLQDRKALGELSNHIKPFILRRLKRDVLKELPEKIEHKMVAELTEKQKKIYLAYLERIKREINEEISSKGFERSQIKILAGLTRLRQICCHPSTFLEDYDGESGKMLLLKEIVGESIDGGHRILLFSQFTSMLDIIRRWLKEADINFMYLDGSTPAEERGNLVKDFNNGQGSIFLISLKAGGTGLNLTGADVVIHYDPWWNPAVEEQATDRAYRIGQDKAVHVMKMITRGTIEEKIFKLQEKKKRLIDAVIQPGETLLSKMNEEEIRALFE